MFAIHFGINLLQSMLGMKGHFTSFLWVADLPVDFTPEVLAYVDTTGLILQVVLFIVAVAAIEWLIRKQEKKKDNLYLN
ncbi:MAG: hypothetical protein AB8H03_17260 [Saprospiraceae bacterium]